MPLHKTPAVTPNRPSYHLAELVGRSPAITVLRVLEAAIKVLRNSNDLPMGETALEVAFQEIAGMSGVSMAEVERIIAVSLEAGSRKSNLAQIVNALGSEGCARRLDTALLAITTLA